MVPDEFRVRPGRVELDDSSARRSLEREPLASVDVEIISYTERPGRGGVRNRRRDVRLETRRCGSHAHVLDGHAIRYRRPRRECYLNRVPQDRFLLDAELLRIGPCERAFEVDRRTIQEHVEDPTRADDRRQCRPDAKLARPQIGVGDAHRALIRIDPRGRSTSIRYDEHGALRQLRAAPALPNFGGRGEAILLALTDEAVDPNDGYLQCKNQRSEEHHTSQHRVPKPYRYIANCFAHAVHFALAKWHECGEIKELL